MNFRAIILLVQVFFLIQQGTSQDFLPDGSFEQINNSGCQNPKNGFADPVFWYPLQGTPDLFSANCPLPPSNEIFWTDGANANEGSNFVGLRCRVNANQTYISEGIATELNNPVIADQPYVLSLKVRSKGFYQGFPNNVISCPLKPEKKLEVYLHSDTIKVINDFSNGTASSNGDLVATLESDVLESDQVFEEWTLIGTCFVPQENARHFSLIMPLGNFGAFPECAADDTRGTFYSFYYDIDDLAVVPLPESIDTIVYIKENQDLEIYLIETFALEYLSDVNFRWSDGYNGVRRSISKPGFYTIEAMIDCGSIILNLEVIEELLEFPFFIPSIFSPNNDGVNDFFEIFIPSDKTVLSFELLIYDRWGNRVFASSTIDKLWDGNFTQNAAPSGEYIYALECTIAENSGNQSYTKSGSITLVR